MRKDYQYISHNKWRILRELTLAAAFSAFFLSAASFFNNFFNAFFDKGSPFSSNRTSMYQVTVVDELDISYANKMFIVHIICTKSEHDTIAISAAVITPRL